MSFRLIGALPVTKAQPVHPFWKCEMRFYHLAAHLGYRGRVPGAPDHFRPLGSMAGPRTTVVTRAARSTALKHAVQLT